MTDKVQPKQLSPPSEPPVAPWRFATRIAFRFSFRLPCAVLTRHPNSGKPGSHSECLLPWFWPALADARNHVLVRQTSVFHIHTPLVYDGNSRDSDFYWVQAFWILLVSVIATLIWSGLDRKRSDYVTLNKWFRLFVRFALAAQMFEYGMTKVIPTQFPSPSLNTLVTPLGNLSLQGLLWTSVGASPGYEIFTGCAELLAGSAPYRSAHRVAGSIDLPCGHDPGFRSEHDLRHRREDDFVSYHPADVFLSRARVPAARQLLSSRWRRRTHRLQPPLFRSLRRIAHRYLQRRFFLESTCWECRRM